MGNEQVTKLPFQDSKLGVAERIADLLSRLTLEEKFNLLSTHQHAVERLGIKEIHIGAEVARGYVSRNEKECTTVFPEPIGMAGMFDPDLMYQLGEIAGTEARILNAKEPARHLMLWGPTVDGGRDPRWGRNEEGYGEDPYLTGVMTAAYTKGMAGEDENYLRTIPTLKHFCADNNEENRAACSANLEPRTKHEYYYEFFRPAIEEGGARSMMAAYNELSGVPAVINPELQTIIKDQWGLDFVVTDGGDFTQNVMLHHYSETHAETMALVLKAGTDVMTDDENLVRESAREAIARGLIEEKDIDRALANSLRGRFRLGEFDEVDKNPFANPDPALMNCDAYRAKNHQAACEQVVLLKNDGILPIAKGAKLAVVGDLGDENYMDWYTGYSDYLVPIVEGLGKSYGKEMVSYDHGNDLVQIRSKLNGKLLRATEDGTILAAGEPGEKGTVFIKADWGGEVTYKVLDTGYFFTTETMKADSSTTFRWFTQEILRPQAVEGGIRFETYFRNQHLAIDSEGKLTAVAKQGISEAKHFTEEIVSSGQERVRALAKEADVVVVCVGNNPMIIARECYDRTTLSLPPHQSLLVKAASEANTSTVMTIVSGYPYAVSKEAAQVRGVLYTSHAGPELGNAVAEVLCGEYNPAGRLAQTWYVHEDELPSIMDYDIIENNMTYLYYQGKPIYSFGYGLSYSSFEYSNLELRRTEQGTEVTFYITNTSECDGEEVAQVYFHMKNARVKRPIKQLCGFRRVLIPAGETISVTILVKDKTLRFYDVTQEKFTVETGTYEFFCGTASSDIRLQKEIEVLGEVIPPRDLTKRTVAINYDDKKNTTMRWAKNLERHYMCEGQLTYQGVQFMGETHMTLFYSTSYRRGKVRVYCDGALIGEEELEATSSPTGFRSHVIDLEPQKGIKNLEICLDNMNLLEFQLQ